MQLAAQPHYNTSLDDHTEAIDHAVNGILEYLDRQRFPQGVREWTDAVEDMREFLGVKIFGGWAYPIDTSSLHHDIADNILFNMRRDDKRGIFLLGFIQAYTQYWSDNSLTGVRLRDGHLSDEKDVRGTQAKYARLLKESLVIIDSMSKYPVGYALVAENEDYFRTVG